jgi:hypothetical protein
MTLEEWSQVATIVGAPAALGALVYAAIQLRASARVAQGQFILELKQMLEPHRAMHHKLRPGGEWSSKEGGAPTSGEEWSDLEEYMGFFEHCEVLIEDGSLSLDDFRHMFSYRVDNIVANPKIVSAKLCGEERTSWTLFLRLCERLNIAVREDTVETQS